MIDVVIGTRPEAIKLAPIVNELSRRNISHRVITTGQHQQLLDSQLSLFGITPNVRLEVLSPSQSLHSLTGTLFSKLGEALEKGNASIVVAQGDTTSAFVASLCSFYQRKKFFHVEAGLRSGNFESPFPEEFNRRAISIVANFHFAPTPRAYRNLINEGVPEANILMTGNTVIDALKVIAQRSLDLKENLPVHKKLILVTAHRRENIGSGHENIFRAIVKLADTFHDVCFLVPLHPNPEVQRIAKALLKHDRVVCCHPLSYEQLVAAMQMCYFVMTDSGGIQEEAPSLRKPVLVLRNDTERPELIETQLGKLVGTNFEDICREASLLLTDPASYCALIQDESPFGDGKASQRIVEKISKLIEVSRGS